MEPSWSQPIPQAMQRHGAPPKNVPAPEKMKRSPQELDAVEPGHEQAQDRALDRAH